MDHIAYLRLIKQKWLAFTTESGRTRKRTSIELKGLPLYASANSVASAGLKNLIMTMERFGKESLREP
jgi:hypothetical protein